MLAVTSLSCPGCRASFAETGGPTHAQFDAQAIQRAADRAERFVWLDPPEHPGALTIVDVSAAVDRITHGALVRQWAQAVWAAWSIHHATVRRWTEQ